MRWGVWKLKAPDPYRQGQSRRIPECTPKEPEYMRNGRFGNKRTADIAGLGVFPEAFDWVSDFFGMCLEVLSALVSFAFTFGATRGFFAFFNLGSSLESSWSLASVSAFFRFLDFGPAPGSGRTVCFFGGGGVGV